jgi:hypothetical protein
MKIQRNFTLPIPIMGFSCTAQALYTIPEKTGRGLVAASRVLRLAAVGTVQGFFFFGFLVSFLRSIPLDISLILL